MKCKLKNDYQLMVQK